jgi:hypothetical protein
MRLDSIAPNAHYDMEHGKPAALEHDNDGSTIIRYNIEPEMGTPDGESEERQIGWQCHEVRIWDKPTKASLKKAIIRDVIDESQEFAIVNAYNSHVLGIEINPDAVDEYKEFLQFRKDVDTLVGEILTEYEI